MESQYNTIVIDPPWHFNLRADDQSHRNRIPYRSMSLAQIKALHIPTLVDNNGCVVWLWFTNTHLIEAAQLLMHWGCTHKGILTWEKVDKSGKTRLGTGHYLRNCTEHCAIATIGKVPAFSNTSDLARSTPNILKAERREHSRKPDEFYALVETLCPGKRLDMFARQRRSGWDSWGDETDKFQEVA